MLNIPSRLSSAVLAERVVSPEAAGSDVQADSAALLLEELQYCSCKTEYGPKPAGHPEERAL